MSGLGLAIPADLLAIALLAYGTYFRRYHRRDLLLAYVAGVRPPARNAPAKNTPCTRPRSDTGIQREKFRAAFGHAPASPAPNRKRTSSSTV